MPPYYVQSSIIATATTRAGQFVNVFGWLRVTWHCTGCNRVGTSVPGLDKEIALDAAQAHADRCRMTSTR